MTKKPQSVFLTACGVEGCKDLRVMGTPYCHKHATIESRARHGVHGGTLATALITAVLAVWFLYNASTLTGLDCRAVAFNWRGIITGAFECIPQEGPVSQVGMAWLAAPLGVALGSALTIVGFALFMISASIFLVLWNRNRRLS